MNCPNCNEVLVMSERQGVEIDYCPKCRGVWLDRGELDKIIDKSQAAGLGAGDTAYDAPPNRNEYYDKSTNRGEYYDKDAHKYRKKKRGFLGDFFDFD